MRLDGILVIDKPAGITSRDAVNRVQTWFPRGTRIGHTGTLDPLATGVLVVCIGAATRLTEFVQDMPKIYRAGIVLGATSDTDDADGIVTPTPNATLPTREEIEQALTAFVGTIEQVPPAYSAAKVSGRRAYALARKGQAVELQPRRVTVHRIEVLQCDPPRLDIEVHCSKGTYIRSIARDLGARLGCGGYITSLRRRAVGSFTEADALPVGADAAMAHERLLPAWRAVQDQPPFALSEVDAARLRNGQRVASSGSLAGIGCVVDPAGRLVGVVESAEGWLRPLRIFGVAAGPV